MMTRFPPIALIGSALILSACVQGDGLYPYTGNPNAVIATNQDTGRDSVNILNAEAAIVYDPDGCQGWMIDDGLEGYAGRRYDPKSGLPVCDDNHPPGTVVGDYQSSSPGIHDYVPDSGN